MNTQLASLVRAPAARVSRADFSPLVRRFSSRFSTSASPRPDEPLVGHLWSRGLLDRLQSPLTRYRE